MVYRINKLPKYTKFKIQICLDENECVNDSYNSIVYIDPVESSSLYQINVENKYKLCGFGFSFFESQTTFDRLVDDQNFNSYDKDKNKPENSDLIIKDIEYVMANVRLADNLQYMDILELNENITGNKEITRSNEIRSLHLKQNYLLMIR